MDATPAAPPAANGDALPLPANGVADGAALAGPAPAGDAPAPAAAPTGPPPTKPPPDCPPTKRLRLRLDSGCIILYAAALPEDQRASAVASAVAESKAEEATADAAATTAPAPDGASAAPTAADVVCLAQETASSLGWLAQGHVVELEQKLRQTHARVGPSAPPLTSVTAPGQVSFCSF
jgi:hypothetical protein